VHAPCEATLLRIFIGDDDAYDNKPLYDQIVLTARAMGMAGATATRGQLAYGPATGEQKVLLRLSEDLPIVIEIIDTEQNVKRFLAAVDPMIGSGLVTLQKVSVVRYGREAARLSQDDSRSTS